MSLRAKACRGVTLLFSGLLASSCGGSGGTPAAPSATPAPSIFRLAQTVHVTPDAQYLAGCFARINCVPARDRFVVTFGGLLAQQAGGYPDKAFSYKSYTTALRETGESGTFACDIAYAGSVMVDNIYYRAAVANSRGRTGCHLMEVDAVEWPPVVDTFFAIGHPGEGDTDPMVAYLRERRDDVRRKQGWWP